MTETATALPPWGRYGKPSQIVPGPRGHLVVDLTDHGEPWPEHVRERYAGDVDPEHLDDYLDVLHVHRAMRPDERPAGCVCRGCAP